MPLIFYRCLIIIFLFLYLSANISNAATTYPFVNATLKLPELDEPFAGLGNNSSSLAEGIRTVLWNPAALHKTNGSESYLGITALSASSQVNKAYTIQDITIEVTGTASLSATGNYTTKILFTSNLSSTTLETRDFTGSLTFTPINSGTSYKQALKLNDWVSFGITSRGNTYASLDIGGDFPTQYLSEVNLYNSTNFMGSGISVDQAGKFTYAYNSGGLNYTYTTSQSAWSNFLQQSQRIPCTAVTYAQNNMDIQSNLIFSGATSLYGILAGINLTPISASLNIDNTIRAIVNSQTPDPFYYVPNFDPTNQTEVAQWFQDPTKYAAENGYEKSYIRVPDGESVGEAKYTGFYKANTFRYDLGFMYDVGPLITIGCALENIGGASLNFTGIGRVAYVNTRINTNEAISLIDPANSSSSTSWNPFSDTFSPVSGTENIGMLPQININLPRRTRIGVTIRKPILLTFDYEVQSNPLVFTYKNSSGVYTEAQLSNIRILRGGMETQLFFTPIWLKGNLALLWKPYTSGLDESSTNSFNSMFPILDRFAPLSLDLAALVDLFGYKTTGSVGFDISSVFSLVQLDTLSPTFGKTMYYNLSLSKDSWHCVLQNNLDIFSTAAELSGKNISSATDIMQYIKYFKWISTLTFGFKF